MRPLPAERIGRSGRRTALAEGRGSARPPALRHSRGIASVAFAVVVAVAALLWVRSIGGPEVVRERYGLLAPALSLLAHTAVNTTPVGDFLPWALANGTVYGFAEGALLNWLAWLGSALLQFLIARRTAHDFALEERVDGLPRWIRRFPANHPAFLVMARWVPLGAPVANLAAGALGVRLSRLLWCAALGAAPPAIALSALGAGMLQIV